MDYSRAVALSASIALTFWRDPKRDGDRAADLSQSAITFWKKIRRKELTVEEGQHLVADMGVIAVETVSWGALAEDAHALAVATGQTVYDCMYVALAARLNTRSITADDRLEAALRRFPTAARHIQLLQTFETGAEPEESE